MSTRAAARAAVRCAGSPPRGRSTSRSRSRFVVHLERLAQPVLSALALDPRVAGHGAAAAAGGRGSPARRRRSATSRSPILGGPVPGRLQLVSTETLAIHVSLPFMLVVALAYAAEALRRLVDRADGARAARDRGRAQADRLGAARLRQAAPARCAPARDLAARASPRAAGEDGRPSRGRARVRRVGHGHEPGRAALAARGPAPGRGAARPRATSSSTDGRPQIDVRGRSAGASAAGRRARLPDRGRGADERAPPRGRRADRDHVRAARRRAAASSFKTTVVDCPSSRREGASGLLAMENRAATIGARLTIGAAEDDGGTRIELDIPLDSQRRTHMIRVVVIDDHPALRAGPAHRPGKRDRGRLRRRERRQRGEPVAAAAPRRARRHPARLPPAQGRRPAAVLPHQAARPAAGGDHLLGLREPGPAASGAAGEGRRGPQQGSRRTRAVRDDPRRGGRRATRATSRRPRCSTRPTPASPSRTVR